LTVAFFKKGSNVKLFGLNKPASLKPFAVILAGILLGSLLYYCAITLAPHAVILLDYMNLGKTHFIIDPSGQMLKHSGSNKQKITPTKIHPNEHLAKLQKDKGYTVLFSPDDDIYKVLLSLIEQEKESIKMAIFTFTDVKIAQALQAACQRGVTVEVITDRACIADRYAKIDMVHHNGGQVYVYNPNHSNKKNMGIMHHKFILFEKNYTNTTLVWTGSYNFTKSANLYNQENIVIMNRSGAAKKFADQFEVLRSRSLNYKPFLTPITMAQRNSKHQIV
jgi:mitochondrial cardiolipin hydrolase